MTIHPPTRTVCFLSIALLFLAIGALCQTGTATLSGIVTDEAGAIVRNCDIQLQSVARNNVITTKTNNDGIYVFAAVQPGSYNLTIRRNGFKQVDFLGLLLNTQDHVQQNFKLQVGSVSESVTVSADAEQLETDNPAVGLLVGRTFVENMPLNGRSFQDLIALAPGTTVDEGTGKFSVNGQRSDSNYYAVDGAAANLDAISGQFQTSSGSLPSQTALGTTQGLASVDAIQEFRVQTSGYAAEYGRQPGGQIEITSRSGTNEIHGSAFDYFRNEALDANDWFANAFGVPRPPERQNDFGGTLGGPISLPKLYSGKNRSFFFFSYEGLRLRTPDFLEENTPTVAFRQSAAQSVQPLLNAFPIPNGKDNGNGTGVYGHGYGQPSSIDATSVRFDQSFGERLQLFGRFSDAPSSETTQNGSSLTSNAGNLTSLTVGATSNISNNIINEFRFNYSQSRGELRTSVVSSGGSVPFQPSLVLPSQVLNASPFYTGYLSVNLSSAGIPCCPGLSYGAEGLHLKQFDFVDSVSLTHGNHSFKAGVDYRRVNSIYGTGATNFLGIDSLAAVQQGYADYLFKERFGGPDVLFQNLSLYFQDQWKLRSRLTFVYGVRWELNPPPSGGGAHTPPVTSVADPTNLKFAPTGSPLYETSYKNFAPRLGFAYQAWSLKGQVGVVRGGAGIFYDTGQTEQYSPYIGFPYANQALLSNVQLPAQEASLAPLSLPVPFTPPYGPLQLDDPRLKMPYTEQWNLSVDQSLGQRNTLTVSYVGNAGRRLMTKRGYDVSQINPDYTIVYVVGNQAFSDYNSLQIQDRGTIGRLQLIASYTWAHAMDNASTDEGVSAQSPGLARGNSDYDIRQKVSGSMIYKIPGARQNAASRVLTDGWSLNPWFFCQTGFPFDVLSPGTNNPVFGEQYIPIRADRVPNVPLYLYNQPGIPGGWSLNPAAFSAVPLDANGFPLRQGTLGRNYVHGPGIGQINLGLQRTFPIFDKLTLEFRAEAFNVLNHPSMGYIDNQLGDPTFGQATESFSWTAKSYGANPIYRSGGARSMQIALKLLF